MSESPEELAEIYWHGRKPMLLEDWLAERAANCELLAEQKTGADRDGWLSDKAYFEEALFVVLAAKRLAAATLADSERTVE